MGINETVTLADKNDIRPEIINRNEKHFQNTLDIAAAVR